VSSVGYLTALTASHSQWTSHDIRGHINALNAKLNTICHLLSLLAHPILHINRIRVNLHTDSEIRGFKMSVI
jgi:hypothetical protein